MGIDVARGLAIFGMIGVHVGISTAVEGGNQATWTSLVEGRSSILFAVVAGISVALATGSMRRPTGEALRSARLRMAGRALAVLGIGLALELLGSNIAVILPVYGVLFLIVIPFIGLRRRTLAITSAALTLTGPTLIAALQAFTFGGSGAGVDFLIRGSYPLTVWLPLILAGMVLGRSNLGEIKTAASVLGIGVVLAVSGYTIGTAINGTSNGWLSTSLFGSSSVSSSGSGSGSWFSSMPGAGSLSGSYAERLASADIGSTIAAAWGVGPHSGGTFEIIGSGGFAFAVVGASLLLARRLRVVLVPLAAVGSMPLTAYAAHVISFAVLITPLGLAPGLIDGEYSLAFWFACIAVLLVGCTAWALTMGRGPLERVTAWAARSVDGAPARNIV